MHLRLLHRVQGLGMLLLMVLVLVSVGIVDFVEIVGR
jgi:hypothetical protein